MVGVLLRSMSEGDGFSIMSDLLRCSGVVTAEERSVQSCSCIREVHESVSVSVRVLTVDGVMLNSPLILVWDDDGGTFAGGVPLIVTDRRRGVVSNVTAQVGVEDCHDDSLTTLLGVVTGEIEDLHVLCRLNAPSTCAMREAATSGVILGSVMLTLIIDKDELRRDLEKGFRDGLVFRGPSMGEWSGVDALEFQTPSTSGSCIMARTPNGVS